MANTEAGTAYVSIMPSMRGFQQELSSGIGAAVDGIAGKLTRVLAGIGIGKAIGDTVRAATEAYSDFQQLSGGVEKIFGDAAATVQANALAAYDTMGVSQNQYMQQVTSFAASLKQSFGGDVAKAAESANVAMGDMADNASIFGTSMEDVQNAYQGFAKQNYTMLDNLKLGYGGTKTEMERLIKDANAYERAQGRAGDLTIDKFGDVVQAIHDVQKQQGILGNSAGEMYHTLSGSIDMTKASWENLLTSLGSGEGVGEAFQSLMTSVGAVVANVGPVVAQIGASIVESLPTIVPQLARGVADVWAEVSSIVEGSTGIVLPEVDASALEGSLDAVAGAVGTVLDGIAGAYDGLMVSLEENGSVGDMLAGIHDQFVTALPDVEDLGDVMYDVGETVGEAVSAIADAVGSSGIAAALGGVVADVLGLGSAIQEVLPGIDSVYDGFYEVSSVLLGGIADAIASFADGLKAAFGDDATLASLQQLSSALQALWQDVLVPLVGLLSGPVASFLGYLAGGAIQVVIDLVTAAAVVVNDVVVVVGTVVTAITGLVQGLVGFLSGVPGAIEGFFSGVGAFFSGLWSGVCSAAQAVWQGLVDFVGGIPASVEGFFSGLQASLQAVWDGVLSGATSAFQGIVDFVAGIPGEIVGFFTGLGASITSAIGSIHFPTPHIEGGIEVLGVTLPTVNWYATGGLIAPNSPRLIGVGDSRSYEHVTPDPMLYDTVRRAVAAEGGGPGGPTYVLTMNGSTFNDVDMMSTTLWDFMTGMQRRAGMNVG